MFGMLDHRSCPFCWHANVDVWIRLKTMRRDDLIQHASGSSIRHDGDPSMAAQEPPTSRFRNSGKLT